MRWLFAWIIMALAAAPALAEPRIALVIGNSSYSGGAFGPLKNPGNDARLMEKTLKGLGFEVETLTDASQKQMEEAIGDLGARLGAAGPDAVGLFYYSGHGVQSQGMNYLVPSDARVFSEPDLWRQAPSLGLVEKYLGYAGNRVNFIILDACRSNTLPRGTRDSGAGLAPARSGAEGLLIAYSTMPGAVATDGEGVNSPYTAALADVLISGAGLPAELLFKRTGERVRLITDGVQQPWIEGALNGDFCFGRCDSRAGARLEESEAALHRARADKAEQNAAEAARQLAELRKQQIVSPRLTPSNQPPDPEKDFAFFQSAHAALANLVLADKATTQIAAPSRELDQFIESMKTSFDEFVPVWDGWAAKQGMTYRGVVPGGQPAKITETQRVAVGQARMFRSQMENEINSLETLRTGNDQGGCERALDLFMRIGWKRFSEAQQGAADLGIPFKPAATPKLRCTPDIQAFEPYADQYLDQVCAVFQPDKTKSECERIRRSALERPLAFDYPSIAAGSAPTLDIRTLAAPPVGDSARRTKNRWFEDAGIGWTDRFDVWHGPISKGKRDGCGLQLQSTGEFIRGCFVADKPNGIITVAIPKKGYFRGEWNEGSFVRKVLLDVPAR